MDKKSKNGFYVFAKLELDEVLPFIKLKKSRRTFIIEDKTYNPNIYSIRLNTFKKGIDCHYCGIKGTHFNLEQNSDINKGINPHLNLYSNDILMTYDHIVAKNNGGLDHIDNTTTSCLNCNNIKSAAEYDHFIEWKDRIINGDKIYRLTFVDRKIPHIFTDKKYSIGDYYNNNLIEGIYEINKK